MVFKINSRNPKNFIFTTMLYNSNMELLGKNRMDMPMEERNDFFTDFLLTPRWRPGVWQMPAGEF